MGPHPVNAGVKKECVCLKSRPGPKDRVTPADKGRAAASSPPGSRAHWGASDAEEGLPLPVHYKYLESRWHTYTLRQQEDFTGDEDNIIKAADDIKARESKVRV